MSLLKHAYRIVSYKFNQAVIVGCLCLQPSLAISDTSQLQNKLVTNLNTSTNSFWRCTVEIDPTPIADFLLKFNSDGSGVAGAHHMSWRIESDTSVFIETKTERLKLNSIQFQSDDNFPTEFNATSSASELIRCFYEGPSRKNTLYDDNQSTGAKFHTNGSNENEFWFCSYSENNGNSSTVLHRFWSNGVGKVDDELIEWYSFDDNILIHGATQARIIENIRFDPQSTEEIFTAGVEEFHISCLLNRGNSTIK